jgi:hypothetical protein
MINYSNLIKFFLRIANYIKLGENPRFRVSIRIGTSIGLY